MNCPVCGVEMVDKTPRDPDTAVLGCATTDCEILTIYMRRVKERKQE